MPTRTLARRSDRAAPRREGLATGYASQTRGSPTSSALTISLKSPRTALLGWPVAILTLTGTQSTGESCLVRARQLSGDLFYETRRRQRRRSGQAGDDQPEAAACPALGSDDAVHVPGLAFGRDHVRHAIQDEGGGAVVLHLAGQFLDFCLQLAPRQAKCARKPALRAAAAQNRTAAPLSWKTGDARMALRRTSGPASLHCSTPRRELQRK